MPAGRPEDYKRKPRRRGPGPQGGNLMPWKPVISKEMGPGIRHGDVFVSLRGKSYNLGESKSKSGRKRRSR